MSSTFTQPASSLGGGSSVKSEESKAVLALYAPILLPPVLSSGLGSLFREVKDPLKQEGSEIWAGPIPLSVSPIALRAIARSVYRPGKTFRMRLTRNAVVTTSGAGALQIASNITPANMSEYSAVSALFQEARLMSTRITYAMYSQGNSPTTVIGIAISFDPSNYSTAPTHTYALQQPGAKLFNTNSAAGSRLTNFWKGDGKRPWSLTIASGSGTDPMGGIVGTWYSSLSGVTTASQNLGTYLIEVDYEFRNPL